MSNRSKRRMTLTPDEENRLFNSYGRTCVGCGRPGFLEIDHVRSVADGGEDSFQNAQPLCPRCNVYKGDRSLDLRGWRGAAPFQLYRRVFWRPGRRRIKWGVLLRLLVRPVLIVMLALALLFLVTPLEDVIRSTLRAWWQDMRWYAYVGAAGWLLWWIAGKRDDRKLVYPDQYGQVPYFKGELRKHPEHAEQRNLAHQRYQIIRANRYIGEKVSIRMDQPKEQPRLEAKPAVPSISPITLLDVLHTFTPSIDRIFLGQSDTGPVYRSLKQMMHAGLLGSSNSGKSTGMLSFAVQLALIDGARIVILDPQAKTFSALRTSPTLLLPFPMDDRECLENFEALQALLKEREDLLKRGGAFDWFEYNAEHGGDLFPIFCFVDEAPVLAMLPEAVDGLMELARRGRAYGFYLVLASQGFRREDVGNTAIRQQITTKLVLRCGEEAQARTIGGLTPAQVDQVVNFREPGMALFRPDDGTAQVVRLPYISPKDAQQILLPKQIEQTAPIVHDVQDTALETPISEISAYQHIAKQPESPPSISASNAYGDMEISPQERDDILLLARVDLGNGKKISRRAICRAKYGTDGGPPYQKVKAVLDAEGL